jgi:endonuclease III
MTEAKKKERKARVKKLLVQLKKLFPDAKIALNYSNNWELLVAVILSAQCTDKKVNEVTEKLFKKYKKLDDYVQVRQSEFEKDIKQTGFYRNKAKNILATAGILSKDFGGKVPKTMKEMLTLPGVARKTGNVVLSNAYGVVEGIAVDTHVHRFALRYDLTDFPKNTDKIEQDLMEIVPKSEWKDFTYCVIEYGRHVAPARVYDTSLDPLVKIYQPAGKIFRK